MKNNLLILLIISLLTISCEKDDNDISTEKQSFLYKQRISEISCKSADEDYKLRFVYKGHQLDSILKYNKAEEMVGFTVFNVSATATDYITYFREILQKKVEEKIKSDTTFEIASIISLNYDDNNIIDETIEYRGREDDFNEAMPKYEVKDKVKFIYEYFDNRLIKIRCTGYSDKRIAFKAFLNYNENRLSSVDYYKQNDIGMDIYMNQNYIYEGALLKYFEIKKDDEVKLKTEFKYSGDNISSIINSPESDNKNSIFKNFKYTYDNNGNLTEIKYGDNNIQKIIYENKLTNIVDFNSYSKTIFHIKDILGELDNTYYFNYILEQ